MPVVCFSEIATPERAYEAEYWADFADYGEDIPAETIALDQQIKAYMKVNGVSYRTAFDIITRGA